MRIGYDPEVRYHHLEVDAAARIAWGYDSGRVRARLRAEGLPSGRIRRVVDEASAVRDATYRRRGVLDLIFAALVSIPALVPSIPILLADGPSAGVSSLFPYRFLLLLAATWLSAQGLTRLLGDAAHEHGPNRPDPVRVALTNYLMTRAILIVVVLLGVSLAHLLN